MRYPEDAEPAYDAEPDKPTEPHEGESLLDVLSALLDNEHSKKA